MAEILIHQPPAAAQERSLLDRITALETNYEECTGKVNSLNTTFHTNKIRLDGFGKELKILLAEINIIAEWIYDKFGLQLIDKQSFLFQHIQDYDEVENIASIISLAKSHKRRKSDKQRYSLETSDESESDDEEVEEPDDEEDLDIANSVSEMFDESAEPIEVSAPEESVDNYEFDEEKEAEDVAEGSRPRRKSRRKVNYKESGTEPNDHEFTLIGKLGKKLLLKKVVPGNVGKVPKKRGRKPGGSTKTTGETSESLAVNIAETKVPKRGRPKKPPCEKIENWKNRLPVQCDECGKIFKGAGSLRTHKMIHLGSRPFECKQCGKAFRRKHHLQFHLMVHAGDKKLQCRFCGKLFHIPRDLSRHERTHTGEKPYACHLCPKTFNIKPHLTMHVRTHTGERPYRCSICEKCFSQSNSLRIHKKIHLKIPNNDPESKKRTKTSGQGVSGSRKFKQGSRAAEADINQRPNGESGVEMQQSESSNIIVVVDESLNPIRIQDELNLINIPEHTGQQQSILKSESPPSQIITNYLEEDHHSTMQQQNLFDPVQQAWRMAISQAQQSQTTSVIMNSRDNQSGNIVQIRNSGERILPPPTTTTSTHSNISTFTIPQFYDPNLRYFSP